MGVFVPRSTCADPTLCLMSLDPFGSHPPPIAAASSGRVAAALTLLRMSDTNRV